MEDERVRVEDAVPPEVRLRLVGLSEAVNPDGDTDDARLTVPAKLLTLVSWIAVVVDEPDWNVTVDGLLVMVKSGVPPEPIVTV